MNQDQDWTEAYKEICTFLKNEVTEVKHYDLWYEQTNYLEEEYPFPEQCIFLDFDMPDTDTVGVNVQACNTIITVYHVFKTLSDSYDQSTNQSTALSFMPVQQKIHKCLQSRSGVNFSPLDRKSNKRIPHPEGYLMIRAMEYHCILMDYSAMKDWVDETITTVTVNRTVQNPSAPDTDMYRPEL